jgi:hypothetical protein
MKRNARERDCSKCGGSGYISRFGHYAQGVCFDCGGTGIPRMGGRGRATSRVAEPESVEKQIARSVSDLRTMWRNYTIHRQGGTLDELWILWSTDRFDREWLEYANNERASKPASPSEADGKRAWVAYVQGHLDDLRQLGAVEKADEIAAHFKAGLNAPVKNARRRTSRARRTSRRRR